MLGLLRDAVPHAAGDGKGGVKGGSPDTTSVDDTSEEVAVALTAEAAVHGGQQPLHDHALSVSFL